MGRQCLQMLLYSLRGCLGFIPDVRIIYCERSVAKAPKAPERSVANPSYVWGLDLAGYLIHYQFFEKMVQKKKVLVWDAESVYGVTRPDPPKKYVF